jgi:hypothetical protein
MTSDAVLRQMRALTLPLVLFTTALAGHVAAGGATPSALVLVPVLVLTMLAVVSFGDVLSTPACCLAVLAGGQGLLHAAFQLLGGSAVTATTTMHGAVTSVSVIASPTSSHVMAHHGAAASHGLVPMSGEHVGMLLAHLAAAVLILLWLAAGEWAFWTLLTLTAVGLVNVWRTVTAAARGRISAVSFSCPRLQPDWDLRCVFHKSVWAARVLRRGPPGTRRPQLLLVPLAR